MYFLRTLNFNLDFIHPGIRFRILKFLTKILSFTNEEFEVSFEGKRYKGNLSNHIDFLTFFFGCYEKGILNLLSNKIFNSGMVVFDVGANIGHHSLYFSTKCKKVYSFEPYPKVRSLLEEKININNVENIEVVPFGLSNERQTLEYFEPPKENSGVGSFQPGHYLNNTSSGVKFDLLKGDDFVKERSLSQLDFIKIDVEGFEHFVLMGLKDMLAKYRPIVLMEFNLQTQAYCKNREGFNSLFPESYTILKLNEVFHKNAKITNFDFNETGDINLLIVPQEKNIKW